MENGEYNVTITFDKRINEINQAKDRERTEALQKIQEKNEELQRIEKQKAKDSS